MLSPVVIVAFILAGLFFGSQFIPQKFCPDFDTKPYNLSMIIGIIIATFITAAFSLIESQISGNVPKIELGVTEVLLCIGAGVIWSLGNFFILSAISKIGISRTFPIVNLVIVVTFFAGTIFLGELESINYVITLLLIFGIASVLVGSFFTSKATSKEERVTRDVKGGVAAALYSIIFFGLYNVPILISLRTETWSAYLAVFFLSLGALIGVIIFGLIWLRKRYLELWYQAKKKYHLLAITGGILWGLGQLFATITMTYIGVAIGAPLIQGFVIVVGAVWGLVVFKELRDIPLSKQRKARIVLLVGCGFALIGSLVMGYIASLLY